MFGWNFIEAQHPTKPINLPYQDREWTSKDGRKITARAISKNENKATFRMPDGKRVEIPFDKLSEENVKLLIDWKPPVVKVEERNNKSIDGHNKLTIVKEFVFRSSGGGGLVIREEQIPELLQAIKEFFVLASKPLADVDQYEKVIMKGSVFAVSGEADILTFLVRKGKPVAYGRAAISTITPEELLPLQDFLETFSSKEWHKQQEEIKKRFE